MKWSFFGQSVFFSAFIFSSLSERVNLSNKLSFIFGSVHSGLWLCNKIYIKIKRSIFLMAAANIQFIQQPKLLSLMDILQWWFCVFLSSLKFITETFINFNCFALFSINITNDEKKKILHTFNVWRLLEFLIKLVQIDGQFGIFFFFVCMYMIHWFYCIPCVNDQTKFNDRELCILFGVINAMKNVIF